VAVADADQVIVVEPDERLVDGFGGATLEVGDEFFNRNRTAPVQEGPENPSGQRCFPGGTSGWASALEKVLTKTVARCAAGTGSHCVLIDALYRYPCHAAPVKMRRARAAARAR
jgi:hypothetical protein